MGFRSICVLLCIVAFSVCYGEGQNQTGVINGHAYVDLGLPSGTLWATCNIGAEEPSDFGDYFAWGEVTPKEWYDQYNYEFYSEDGWLSIGDDISGTEYDAATYNWGDAWRIPTFEQFRELYEECRHGANIVVDDIHLWKFIGPNDNHIIIPIGGCMYQSTLFNGYKEGSYWTSSYMENELEESKRNNRYASGFHVTSYSGCSMEHGYSREIGISIRPVTDIHTSGLDHIVQIHERAGISVSGRTVRFTGTDNSFTLQISDISGRSVYSCILTEQEITLSQLNPGVYIVTISDGKQSVLSKKIILN